MQKCGKCMEKNINLYMYFPGDFGIAKRRPVQRECIHSVYLIAVDNDRLPYIRWYS